MGLPLTSSEDRRPRPPANLRVPLRGSEASSCLAAQQMVQLGSTGAHGHQGTTERTSGAEGGSTNAAPRAGRGTGQQCSVHPQQLLSPACLDTRRLEGSSSLTLPRGACPPPANRPELIIAVQYWNAGYRRPSACVWCELQQLLPLPPPSNRLRRKRQSEHDSCRGKGGKRTISASGKAA